MKLKLYVLIIMLATQNGVLPAFAAPTVNAVPEINQEIIDIKQSSDTETDERIKETPVLDVEVIEEPVVEVKSVVEFNTSGMILNQGKLSTEILRLNKYLKQIGYDVQEIYEFNWQTRKAVEQYQKSKGLNVDGSAGPKTVESLNKDMKEKGINVGEIKVNTNETKEMIVINKSSNTLYHIKDKNIIKQYPVATGKHKNSTPTGQFTIVTKSVNPSWGGAGKYKPIKGGAPNNPLGKRWMGLSLRGGGWYGIHGNANFNSIGTYASMGCIRMYNQDAEGLYEIINKGIPVWIGFEDALKTYGVEFYINNVSQ